MLRLRASRLMQLIMTMVWCGVVAARPMALPCPVGGHGAHQTEATHAPSVSAPADAHSAHGHHGAPATPTPAPTHAPAHQCDCLGHCCSTALAMPATTPAISSIVEQAMPATPSAPNARVAAAWTDFVLPFAIAPPVSALS